MWPPRSALRRLSLVAALPALALGCGAKNLGPLTQDGSAATELDVLFVVPDSMASSLQATLSGEFAAFFQAVRAGGPSPDLHIGVISSSLGAGMAMEVPLCPPGGEG